jgi:hypothetical protein
VWKGHVLLGSRIIGILFFMPRDFNFKSIPKYHSDFSKDSQAIAKLLKTLKKLLLFTKDGFIEFWGFLKGFTLLLYIFVTFNFSKLFIIFSYDKSLI